jgi:hypothetical protein
MWNQELKLGQLLEMVNAVEGVDLVVWLVLRSHQDGLPSIIDEINKWEGLIARM